MHVRNKPPPKTTILVQHVHECAPTTRKSTQQVEQRKKKRKPQETMFCDHHKGAKSSIYGDLIPNDTPIVPH